jgi:hypothetical protein
MFLCTNFLRKVHHHDDVCRRSDGFVSNHEKTLAVWRDVITRGTDTGIPRRFVRIEGEHRCRAPRVPARESAIAAPDLDDPRRLKIREKLIPLSLSLSPLLPSAVAVASKASAALANRPVSTLSDARSRMTAWYVDVTRSRHRSVSSYTSSENPARVSTGRESSMWDRGPIRGAG